MKLYIKQQVFTWGDKFEVKDSEGNARYFVEGEVFSWGKKLHIYDTNGVEVIYIAQELMTFLPRYQIFVNNILSAEIVKEFSFFLPRYRIDKLGWKIEGHFGAHDYTITQNNSQIVSISKNWFTWGDSYVLDINDPQNELVALAVVITIDCVIAQSS